VLVDVLVLVFGVLSGFVTVVELLEDEEPPPAGEGLTIVVLCSVLSGPGAAVSVFCSQATKRAAPAKMQRYFFIVCGLSV